MMQERGAGEEEFVFMRAGRRVADLEVGREVPQEEKT